MNGTDKLIIIEKYDDFVNYIYPVLQNIARKHGIIKEKTIHCIFEQIELFYKAIKSNQKTKLFEADANLAIIRYYLRFLADKNRKLIFHRLNDSPTPKSLPAENNVRFQF